MTPTQIAAATDALTDQEAEALLYDWPLWARDKQLPPDGDWRVWLILAGRGFGKSRTGAEWVRESAESGKRRYMALVGETAADVRDVMVEGEAGILAKSPPWFYPKYEPSKRRLTWPNGAIATTYSGDDPEQLRGPQHDGAWADELAKYRYAQETWDNLEFGLRLGKQPQAVVTTTPRPLPIIKDMLQDPAVTVTTGSTYENAANLAGSFIDRVIRRYEGTRLGQQELHAAILGDVPGALWKRDVLESTRVREAPQLSRVVIGVDPNASSDETAAEAGIVAVGATPDGHGYVIDDRTVSGSPSEWASAAVSAYSVHNADRIIVERNNGGDMVEYTIRTISKNVPVTTVWASRGKYTRAEPISALYEQGKMHHVGMFAELEDQLCSWVPGMASPDRLDALVWACTYLFPNSGPVQVFV